MEKVNSLSLQKRMTTLDLVYIAMGIALIVICSWINIPMTVPFTLQTFAVFAVLLMLGGDRGTAAIFIYVLMGAVGIPVFAGFTGGIGILLGNTGGYLMGFLLIGVIYLAFTRFLGKKPLVEIAALLFGLFLCYTFGTAWFIYIYTRDTGVVGLMTVLSWCVFPFIIPDIIKMALAVAVSRRVRNVMK